MAALARVGDTILREVNPTDTQPDTSRKPSKMPKQLAALVALRAQGFDNEEIAARLQCSSSQLKGLIRRAREKYGWSDIGATIAHVAVPQAVSNIVKHLDYEGTKAAIEAGRSTVTLKTMAGTGLYRQHTAIKQDKTTETRILRVEITIPAAPPTDPASPVGSVFATPRTLVPPPVRNPT